MTELRTFILLAIGAGPAHGYAIGKEIETRSGGRIDPSTGALYQALKRLSEEGLVRAVAPPRDETTDARRNYFEITAAGRRALEAEMRRLDDVVTFAKHKRLYRGAR